VYQVGAASRSSALGYPHDVARAGLLIYTLAAVRLLLFLASRSWVGALAAAIAIVLLPVVIYTRDG
jgi:hypothetical protein